MVESHADDSEKDDDDRQHYPQQRDSDIIMFPVGIFRIERVRHVSSWQVIPWDGCFARAGILPGQKHSGQDSWDLFRFPDRKASRK